MKTYNLDAIHGRRKIIGSTPRAMAHHCLSAAREKKNPMNDLEYAPMHAYTCLLRHSGIKKRKKKFSSRKGDLSLYYYARMRVTTATTCIGRLSLSTYHSGCKTSQPTGWMCIVGHCHDCVFCCCCPLEMRRCLMSRVLRDLNLPSIHCAGTTIAAVRSTGYLSIWWFNRVFDIPSCSLLSLSNRLSAVQLHNYGWSSGRVSSKQFSWKNECALFDLIKHTDQYGVFFMVFHSRRLFFFSFTLTLFFHLWIL